MLSSKVSEFRERMDYARLEYIIGLTDRFEYLMELVDVARDVIKFYEEEVIGNGAQKDDAEQEG